MMVGTLLPGAAPSAPTRPAPWPSRFVTALSGNPSTLTDGGGPLIAKLKGVVDGLGDDWVVIDVGSVGCGVCSPRARSVDGRRSRRVEIETHVQEDRIQLYGFIDGAEREWFKLLTTVQGVGTKLAWGY